MAIIIKKLKVIENSAFALQARVRFVSGALITTETTDAIRLQVWKSDGSELIVPTGEDAETYEGTDLDVNDCVYDDGFDSEDDIRWQASEPGNFSVTLDGSFVPYKAKFQVQVRVTPIAGPAITMLWELDAQNVWEIPSEDEEA